MQKTSMEAVLQQIANTIVLNAGTVNNSGLLDGKMGVILFLYHYSEISGNKDYRDYAVELLNEIPDNLYKTMSVDFVKGLSGIGWGIRYLITKKFVDADADDILEEVDASLINISHLDILSDITNECPFCSKGIYFLWKNDKEAIENVLNAINLSLSKNTEILSLSYLNSILYIILQGNCHMEIFTELLNLLYANIMNSIRNKYYTFPDALLLSNIIEQFKQVRDVNFDSKKWEALLKILDYDNLSGIFNIGIYDLIYNKIKSDDSFILSRLRTMDVRDQINSIIKDVYKNLNVYNGLAGIGLTLCNYFQEWNETL